ncbi:MAG TPA: GIY-YIG nuclease family protein [Burkholderiaceae bacterium]|jgi:putative endonuclease
MSYYVYLLASSRNGTLYIGMTNDLVRRVYEHKEGFVSGFTKQHSIKTLVYYEVFDDPESAIYREKQLKAWKRAWKIELIEQANPYWNDLYADIA